MPQGTPGSGVVRRPVVVPQQVGAGRGQIAGQSVPPVGQLVAVDEMPSQTEPPADGDELVDLPLEVDRVEEGREADDGPAGVRDDDDAAATLPLQAPDRFGGSRAHRWRADRAGRPRARRSRHGSPWRSWGGRGGGTPSRPTASAAASGWPTTPR